LVNAHQPKRRIHGRFGLHVRNPWLDLDLLNFVRKLPLRWRLRKRLFMRVMRRVDPALMRITFGRGTEQIDYRYHLSVAEKRDQTVTKLILADNPLLGEFFDLTAVRRLIDQVCAADVPRPSRRRLDLETILPVGTFWKLYTLRQYLTNPPPNYSGARLVLGIAVAAVALRQLAQRPGGTPSE